MSHADDSMNTLLMQFMMTPLVSAIKMDELYSNGREKALKMNSKS